MIPRNAEICFIDNTHFSKMENERVYYIQPKPYYHGLSFHDITNRLVLTPTIMSVFTDDINDFLVFIRKWFQDRHPPSQFRIKIPTEYTEDILVSQKMMYHVKEFFLLSTNINNTKKLRTRIGHFTKKRRHK